MAKLRLHIILAIACWGLLLLCSCGSQKTFLQNYQQGDELCFLYKNRSFIKVKLNTKDNTFEYESQALDVHRRGKGHWKLKKDRLIMVFDIKPSFERWVEGWLYEHEIIFEIKENTLVYKQHIYPHGISDFPEDIILKPITKDEYDSLP